MITTTYRFEMVAIYRKYQASWEWHNLVNHIKIRDQGQCRDCGKDVPKRAVVHHITYRNWGKGNEEEMQDCVLLCPRCHQKRHIQKIDEHTPFWASRSYSETQDCLELPDIELMLLNEIG